MTQESKSKPVVSVSVLHMGWWRHEIALQMIALSHDPRYDLRIEAPSASPIASNRCEIALRARNVLDAAWILMVDSDCRMGGNPLDMIEKDLDIVAWPALCYKPNRLVDARDPFVWNMTPHDEYGNIFNDMDLDRPVERGGIGAHMMLIARRVLEHPDMRAPFQDEFDVDGVRIGGEDIRFCFRARKAGFKVWAILSEPAGHVKEVDMMVPRRVIDDAKRHDTD
ncbi:MAG: hypothetical protein ABIH46_08395 [Chloroflexota bacterium]